MKRPLTKMLVILLFVCGCSKEHTVTQKQPESVNQENLENTEKPSENSDGQTRQSEQEEVEIETVEAEETDQPDKPDQSDQSEAQPAENTLTLCMVGDILLHTPIEERSRDDNGTYDFAPIFSEMKDDISSYDIAVVNEEVIIGGEELGISGYPAFNAPYAIGDALVNSGFDVICHATNHVLDKGKSGLLNTCNFWNENYPDITVIGINEAAEDKERVDIIERNGIKIALLNYTYGTNGISQPADMPYAVDLLEEDKVIKDLEYAEQNADFTVVFPHWGTEYRLTPDSSQQKWTGIFEEHGADLVIGTHPHVIEPIEFIDDKMLVYYSLGNFVNWTSGTGEGTTNRMVGGMAGVTITKDSDGVTSISDYGVKALVCHVSDEKGGIRVFPLRDYPEELAAVNAIIAQDSSFSKEKCIELCNEVWGDKWD
ncbi:poly-gamma-glutamate synthesis protein (capsule biosynthesis protein) [Butyrivibrio sp. ob235]|uniref:CapA family protein n=1 Tax=Butyrivibrio sp. ob235 TaxID=1761780 RepID=UPI0008D3AC8A|nr:CapA family protein [Butyrivibrio sp. ob235]SEK99306.1 poly-gamma-glutamate synthesis protein (capsule biosynthesis protein) [Butyrivibrio sp. ob235]